MQDQNFFRCYCYIQTERARNEHVINECPKYQVDNQREGEERYRRRLDRKNKFPVHSKPDKWTSR